MENDMRLIDINLAARKLNVSPSTIRRMLADPECPLTGCRLHRASIRVIESTVFDVIRVGMEEFTSQI